MRYSSRWYSRGNSSTSRPARRLTAQEVDLQVTDMEHRVPLRDRLAPYQNFDPGSQLQKFEGLGQVVVATRAEPSHPLVHRR